MKLPNILSILDTMPLHFYWKDCNGIYLGCNLSQAQFFRKKTIEEIIGKTDVELMGDTVLVQAWIKNDQEVMLTGVSKFFEETSIVEQQEQIMLSYKAPIKNNVGEITGLMGISIDVTSQKQIEKKLITEKESISITLDNIMANLPGHVYWMNRENKFLGCNDLQAKHAGLNNRYEIVGKTNDQMPWAEKANILNEINKKVMQTKEEYVVEESGELIDGKNRVFLSRKTPLLNDKNNVVGVLGISFDITDRKKMEQELIKTKEAAEEANRVKTEFLANMSHDVKTPLTGVIGMAELMASDSTLAPKNRTNAEAIHACGKQLLSFFNNCLELSKMEMTEWATTTKTFSLQEMLKDVQALFMPTAINKKILFKVEYDPRLPSFVSGHYDSTYHVILNLVGNALKFTEHGSVTVRVFLQQEKLGVDMNIGIEVKDTGIGIAKDKQKIIFEKLRRLTPSYKSNKEGSGIGLYIVDQYVKRMGGSISIVSEMGKGSAFIVILPMRVGSVENTIEPTQKSKESVVISEKNRAKVLLVEDNPMVQHITRILLQEAGFVVDMANTGKEALEKTTTEKYKLIFMDIGLPDIDGYAVTKKIRLKHHAVPIVALTAHGAVDIQQLCDEAGMQEVVSKPMSKEKLEEVWKKYSNRKKENSIRAC